MSGYIKFDGLEGEAQDFNHKGWTDIVDFRQGFHKPTRPGATGVERRRADTQCDEVAVTMLLDKTAPKLAEALCKGKVFPKVQVRVTTSYADAGRVPVVEYELKDVVVTDFGFGGGVQHEEVPHGLVSLNFNEVLMTYYEYGPEGKLKGKVSMTWKTEEGRT
jgi:type VI secretion system secreted protein Hcp